MRFLSFALVSAVLVAVQVFAQPASGKRVADKTVEQLHEEFKQKGVELQAELKSARERADLKQDAHAQAFLNAIPEADKKLEQLVDIVVDPKHGNNQREVEQLIGEYNTLIRRAVDEFKQVRQEFQQDKQIQRIFQKIGERGQLFVEIASKKRPELARKLSKKADGTLSI